MFDFQTSLQGFIDAFVAFLNSLLNSIFSSLTNVFGVFTQGS